MTDTGHKSGVSMARGLLAQIREIFEGDPGVRKVADDPVLSAELLLLFRMILADGQVSDTEMAVFRRICAESFEIAKADSQLAENEVRLLRRTLDLLGISPVDVVKPKTS
jgi:uncharacterized tellurite resistance protein B-like protein